MEWKKRKKNKLEITDETTFSDMQNYMEFSQNSKDFEKDQNSGNMDWTEFND